MPKGCGDHLPCFKLVTAIYYKQMLEWMQNCKLLKWASHLHSAGHKSWKIHCTIFFPNVFHLLLNNSHECLLNVANWMSRGNLMILFCTNLQLVSTCICLAVVILAQGNWPMTKKCGVVHRKWTVRMEQQFSCLTQDDLIEREEKAPEGDKWD